MISAEMPIGVIDSGVGGISVLKELVKYMPCENYIYFGDSANAPYGTKQVFEVRNLVDRIVKQLRECRVKAVVVACNTATSAAIDFLRQENPDIPVIGIEPALKPAVMKKIGSRVLVMATPMTLNEEKYSHLVSLYHDKAEIVALPCEGLMEFVERGELEGEALEKYLQELFAPYRSRRIDSIVLGCTHYPFVKTTIQKVLPGPINIFDGGEGTARETKRRLAERNLLKDENSCPGKVTFLNSLPCKEIYALCEKLYRT